HEIATAHLGFELVVDGIGRADRELDLFGGALTDRDAVFASHVRLYCGIDVERPDAHGFERNHTAEGNDGDLGRPTTNVDHHVAHRFVDGKSGTDGGGHRLFEQMSLGAPGPARGLEHRALFDVCDRGRHTNQYPGARQAVDAGPLEQQPDHALRDVEVGDGA